MKKVNFEFIENGKLRDEINSVIDFIEYLISTKNNILDNVDILFMVNKTIAVYIGSIIEATLFYTLSVIKEKLTDKEKTTIEKKIRIEDKYRDEKLIYKINDFEEIVCCKKIKNFSTLDSKISFNSMIQLAKNIGIFDEELYDSIDSVRKKRNEIHIHTILDEKTIFTNYELIELYNIFINLLSSLEQKIVSYEN